MFKQYREIVAALKFGWFSIGLLCSTYLFIYLLSILTGCNGNGRIPLAAAACLGERVEWLTPGLSSPVVQGMGYLCRTVSLLASNVLETRELQTGSVKREQEASLKRVVARWCVLAVFGLQWCKRGMLLPFCRITGHGECVQKMEHAEIPNSFKNCIESLVTDSAKQYLNNNCAAVWVNKKLHACFMYLLSRWSTTMAFE